MLEINNKKSPLVLALDIGTTKVCALAGFRNEFGKIEITGIGKVKSEGVSKGVVSNIDKTVKAIKEAVSIAEINCGKKFENVNNSAVGMWCKFFTMDFWCERILTLKLMKMISTDL